MLDMQVPDTDGRRELALTALGLDKVGERTPEVIALAVADLIDDEPKIETTQAKHLLFCVFEEAIKFPIETLSHVELANLAWWDNDCGRPAQTAFPFPHHPLNGWEPPSLASADPRLLRIAAPDLDVDGLLQSEKADDPVGVAYRSLELAAHLLVSKMALLGADV